MHDFIEFIRVAYVVYFLTASMLFLFGAIFNFRYMKDMSTYKLILLYISMPLLYVRAFYEKLNSKSRS